MTQKQTVTSIESIAKHIFAAQGYEGLSMRALAASSGVGLSSIYHFFEDKDALLDILYAKINTSLGIQRKGLHDRTLAKSMLHDRVAFQFDHMEDVVFILKYYLHFREQFINLPTRVLPPKAYLHIEEVLHKGISTGEFSILNSEIETQAKIITHSINGFLLEYYPLTIKTSEKNKIINEITNFTIRSLAYKEANMA